MSTILYVIQSHQPGAPSVGTTLLQLVVQIGEATDSADETVDCVFAALDDGAVHLTGNFRGCRLVG